MIQDSIKYIMLGIADMLYSDIAGIIEYVVFYRILVISCYFITGVDDAISTIFATIDRCIVIALRCRTSDIQFMVSITAIEFTARSLFG